MKQRALFMTGLLGAALVFGSVFVGCENEDTSNRYNSKLGFVDITNAAALMVVPSNSFSRSSRAAGDTVFVKQLSDGTVVEVTVQDVNGNTVSDVPSSILDSSGAYMILDFRGGRYLVNKTTGAAYDLSPVGGMDFGTRVITDSNSNIYGILQQYDNDVGQWNAVHKINVANPEHITVEQLTPSMYSVRNDSIHYSYFTYQSYGFSVDSQGNVLYACRLGNMYGPNSNSISYRLRKADGQIEEVDPFGKIFTGYDGSLYCFEGNALKKLSITGGTAEFITLTENLLLYGGNMIYYLEDKIILMDYDGYSIKIAILYDEHGAPRQLEPIELDSSVSLKFVSAGSSNVYIVTKDSDNGEEDLIKIDLATGEKTTLIEPGAYKTIYKMAATKDDVVIVNALSEKNFEVKKIVANISAEGAITVREDIVGTEIIILERVN
jgi:hypothetical protein